MNKSAKLFLKRNKKEIITFIIDTVLISISFFIFGNWSFLASFFVILISTFIIIYHKTRDKDFYFLPLNKPGQDKDWVGRGDLKFIHNESCHEITASAVGYIFPKTALWDDYKYEFDFKIINSCIAWIVRAVNLSNYVMFQCGFDGINPHIRLNGEWIVKNHNDKDVNMTFEEKLSRDVWYKGKIICEKRSIRITIYDYNSEKVKFDRNYKIPDSLSVKFPKKMIESKSSAPDSDFVIINQNIDFDFGSIGVRNAGEERGYIKNVYVERL